MLKTIAGWAFQITFRRGDVQKSQLPMQGAFNIAWHLCRRLIGEIKVIQPLVSERGNHGQMYPVSIHVTTDEAHFPVTRSISKSFQRTQGSNHNLAHRSRLSARAFNQRAILMILLAPLRTQPERAALPRQIPPDPVALWPASGTMPGPAPNPPCSAPPAPHPSA